MDDADPEPEPSQKLGELNHSTMYVITPGGSKKTKLAYCLPYRVRKKTRGAAITGMPSPRERHAREMVT